MTRFYAIRLLLPLTLIDLLTLGILVELAGPGGEVNPITVAALGRGGLLLVGVLKMIPILAVLGFEAFVAWDHRPAWGPRFGRIASVPLAIGVALNLASLISAASAGAFA
jgi:hypothetical protein